MAKRALIRKGDRTTHGGEVLTGDETFTIHGRAVARVEVPKVIGVVLLSDMSVRGEQRQVEGDLPWWKKSGFGVLPTYDDVATRHDDSTEKQIAALEALTKVLKTNFSGIARFGGHREWAGQTGDSRACPGAYGLIIADMMRRKYALVNP